MGVVGCLLSLISVTANDSMAVECWRHEGKIPLHKDIERHVGGKFHDLGSTFDLDNPKHRFGCIRHQRVTLRGLGDWSRRETWLVCYARK